MFPTNDDLTLVVAGVAHALFDDYHHNVESTYLSMFDSRRSSPSASAARSARERFAGTGDLPNYFRKPYGPGWALVGDAGYHKDPLTAFGITDAFHDVELARRRARPVVHGRPAVRRRDARLPAAARRSGDCRCSSSPASSPRWSRRRPRCKQLLGAVHGNQEAMDDFASVMAGTLPPPAFFNPDNIGRIMAAAGSS